MEGFRGPHNRASAADLEIIVRGEFELENRSQTIVHVHVKANKFAERLAGAFLVLFPSVVFQWRDVIENESRIFRIELRGDIGIQRVPSGIVTGYESMEFIFALPYLGE